jgi:glucose/arabinose dehydrogenase
MKCYLLAILALLGSQIQAQAIHKELAYPNLKFTKPIFLTHAGDKSNRVFVVEQAGKIQVFKNKKTVTKATTFLDISSKVHSAGHEQGLLGLAFDPKYKKNGHLYVYYTTTTQGILSRYTVSNRHRGTVDPKSEKILLSVKQPFANHNGGMVLFGPDGHLYLGLGDGGVPGNSQKSDTLLGSIVRFSRSFKPRIYAKGLRNPWRFSFDKVTGILICGDVGQVQREELNVIVKGGNYGWDFKEGSLVYKGTPPPGLIDPVFEYGIGVGSCIIGGYVYRGKKIPKIYGTYFYGDHGAGKVWVTNGSIHYHIVSVPELSSFGVDEKRELYMLSLDGPVYRLVQ